MTRILCLLFLVAFGTTALAQPYGNEWIDYSKTYYKIKKVGPGFADNQGVTTVFMAEQNGFTRITSTELSNAGLSGLTGNGFKVFYKGKEIPIYVSRTGLLGPSDYIEFYWEENDGELDALLHEDPDWQATKGRSLFTDESRYYLMWDDSTPGKRYVETDNDISGTLQPEPYFMYTNKVIQANAFFAGEPIYLAGANQQYSDYGNGEGFVSQPIASGATYDVNVASKYLYNVAGAPLPRLETKLYGRSDDVSVIQDHHVAVSINGETYIDVIYQAFENRVYSANLSTSDVSNPFTTVSYKSVGDMSSNDQNSVGYVQLTYPRYFNFDDRRVFKFELQDNGVKYLEISNFDGGLRPVLYDLTNNLRIEPILNSGVYQIQLPAGSNGSTTRELMFVNTTVTDCNQVFTGNDCFVCGDHDKSCFSYVNELEPIQFTDYGSAINQGDYIIIGHKNLRTGSSDPIQNYADYRASQQGRNFQPVIVDIDELYDQFAWGINTHPLSIRNFVNYAIDNWDIDPRYLLLVGKSIGYHNIALSDIWLEQDLVPTYGQNAADILLAARGVNDIIPQIPVGRIPAVTPEEVQNYLDKLIDYESPKACNAASRDWIKNLVHVSVGETSAENEEYVEYLHNYEAIVEAPQYAGEVLTTLSAVKNKGNISSLKGYMEDGLGVLTFFGHSGGSGSSWDVKGIGDGDPTFFNNTGRYPFIISASCFVGDIHKTVHTTMAEQYTITADHGSIGFLATVSFGMPVGLNVYCEELYKAFSDTHYGQPMGDCMNVALSNMPLDEVSPNSDFYEAYVMTMQQFTLAGDPAVILGGNTQAEYTISNSSVAVYDPNTNEQLLGAPIIADGDQVNFQVTVENIGLNVNQPFTIQITQELPNGNVVVVGSATEVAPASIDTYVIPVNMDVSDILVPNTFTVTINQGDVIPEDCNNNNTATVLIQQQETQIDCGALPRPVINVSGTAFCIDDGTTQLNPQPSGGTFNGPGVTAYTFDPAQAGEGVHLITYSYTDVETSCQLFSTIEMTVFASPGSAFTVSNQSICVGESVTVNPNGDFRVGANYNWNFGGAAPEGGGSEFYTLTWSSPGVKTITLATSENGCDSGVSTQTVIVDEPLARPTVTCGETTLSSVSYSWDGVTDALGYQVFVNGELTETVDALTNNYQIGDLPQGEEVSLYVVALGSGACGNSDASFPVQCASNNCAPRTITIDNLSSSYCVKDESFFLQGSETGGFFLLNGSDPISQLDPSSLGVGSYNVVYNYTDGLCDYSSQVYEFDIFANPEPNILGQRLFCAGESTELSISDEFTEVLWSDGSTSNKITVTAGGEYSVEVTNSNGCKTISEVVTVTENNIETPTIDAQGVTAICNGQFITLTVQGDYTDYLWVGNASLEASLQINIPGTYSVTVTDDAGCTASQSITIDEAELATPSLLLQGEAVSTDTQVAVCSGELPLDIAVDGSFEIYEWSNSEETSSISVTEAGTYRVTVSNAAGCEARSVEVQVSVTTLEVNLLVDGGAAENKEVCEGETVEVSVDGDFATYNWSNGETGASIQAGAGTYSVVVTDESGCEGQTFSIDVTEKTVEIPTISSSVESVCNGSEITISAPEGYDAYAWNTGETTSSFALTDPGTYTLALTVTKDGCTKVATEEKTVTIFEDLLTDLDISASRSEFCIGEEIELSAINAENAATFDWRGEGLTSTSTEMVIAEPTGETMYTLYVEDINGCGKTDSITLTLQPVCLMPNAITPKRVDGVNDTWQIPQAWSSSAVDVYIFNRWGQQIWSQKGYNNANGWDGTNMDGTELPAATYYYLIELNDGSEPMHGSVTILD